jgi:excisionase family DNA binding protein
MTKALTIKQASEQLSLSRWTVTALLESGALPGFVVKTGKRKKIWRVREDALERWIADKESETRKQIQQASGERRMQAVR